MSAVESFAGLNLVGDPEEVQGAIDLLNVDLDRRGRVRSRDGYNNFLPSGTTSFFETVAPYYKVDGTKQLLAAAVGGPFYRAYDTSGTAIASQAVTPLDADFTRFGGPSAEVAYASSVLSKTGNTSNIVYKWNGSTWASDGNVRLGSTGNYPFALEVKAGENRLVGAFPDSNASRVGFSNPGNPASWNANDWVDLTPGDGERITALVSWREMVLVFKETKFFVFDQTSTQGDGSALFNYRPVTTGVGCITRACVAASPNGVYFLSRRGLYKTTGGDPVLVSRDIDPIFRGGASSFFLGGILNHASLDKCSLTWHDERLYFAYPSGSASFNDRVLVLDPETNTWLLWDVAANAMTSFRIGDAAELVFSYANSSGGTPAHQIGRLSSSYTDDDGTAIASRYQSGFTDFGSAKSKRLRGLSLWGSGAPTVQVASDLGAVDTGGVVTLGTAPASAKGYQRTSRRGTLFSYKLSASTTWAATRLDLDLADERVGP